MPELLERLQKRTNEEVCSMMESQYIAHSGWAWKPPTDSSSCDLGTMNPEAVDDTERRTNFYRNFVGLKSVTYEREELQLASQRGAVAMYQNNIFNHYIPKCTKCCLDDGLFALRRSNLRKGSDTPQDAIDHLIEDAYDIGVGHRVWMFTPEIIQFAVGIYDTLTVQRVMDVYKNSSQTERYYAYPPPGPVPLRLLRKRLSFHSNESFPSGTIGEVTKNGIPITSKSYCYDKMIVIDINEANISVDSRYKVTISNPNWTTSEYIEYEFWTIDCFKNYICVSYTGSYDEDCPREYNRMTFSRGISNLNGLVEGDDVNIILVYFGHDINTDIPSIEPSAFLKKNHLIKTNDASGMIIKNNKVNQIDDSQHTKTKLYHLYLGFSNITAINLWDLEMIGITFIGSYSPNELSANDIVTDTDSLKATHNFLKGKSITIDNCNVNEIEIKNNCVIVNGAQIILNNYQRINIHVTEVNFTIVTSTDNFPEIYIISDETINVTYKTSKNWEEIGNKENIHFNNKYPGETIVKISNINIGLIIGMVVLVIVVIVIIIVIIVLWKKGKFSKKKDLSSN
ncbi:CAP domain-containing protein [Histomonas meleagridis]|uniref:CAP domain-containing protein n=1 Tax=Histomonas meleagridis TaxID=135588 RepID=UPI00355AAC3E|nr:CAP domain-containing protein [Histomonas meleagridis]